MTLKLNIKVLQIIAPVLLLVTFQPFAYAQAPGQGQKEAPPKEAPASAPAYRIESLPPIQSQTQAPAIQQQGQAPQVKSAPQTLTPPKAPEGKEATKDAKKVAEDKSAAKVKKTNDYALYLKAGDRSPKWNEFIEPAFSSFDSGHYSTAAIFLKKAHERGCRDGLLLYRLGIYQELQKQYKEAAELLAEAAEKVPKQYPSHPLAGGIHEHAARALYQVDDYERALPALKKALEHEPEDFLLLFMSGQLLRLAKSLPEARAAFEKALTVKPPEGLDVDPKQKVWRELMAITYEQKDFEACAAYAAMLLAANPNDSVALSYKQNLDREKFLQRQMEAIKKMSQ